MSKHIWADPGNERLAKLLGEPVTEPDYKKVAEALRCIPYRTGVSKVDHDAAIALCELAAKLAPGEAERVLLKAAASTPYQCNLCSERCVRLFETRAGLLVCEDCK